MPKLEWTVRTSSSGVYPRFIVGSPPGLRGFTRNDTLLPVFARPDRAEAISVAGTMGAGTSPAPTNECSGEVYPRLVGVKVP